VALDWNLRKQQDTFVACLGGANNNLDDLDAPRSQLVDTYQTTFVESENHATQ